MRATDNTKCSNNSTILIHVLIVKSNIFQERERCYFTYLGDVKVNRSCSNTRITLITYNHELDSADSSTDGLSMKSHLITISSNRMTMCSLQVVSGSSKSHSMILCFVCFGNYTPAQLRKIIACLLCKRTVGSLPYFKVSYYYY